MSFQADNTAFEDWLRTQCQVVKSDLDYKHERMRRNSFVFLRATYFRWAKRIESLCPECARAPKALSVGDTHTENFGTWRDAEGRLVWGVNDFDEAAVIPYPFDLIRLATSVRLAPKRDCSNRDAADAILLGYLEGLSRPRPILLDEQETWMREYVACSDDQRRKFWAEVEKYPDAEPPVHVEQGLRNALPVDAVVWRFASRVKGGGSLGRPRFVAIAKWRGGKIVREAKALVPSAWNWAHGDSDEGLQFLKLASGNFRAPDPFLNLESRFIIRRVAADSRKINLGDEAGADLKTDLLRVMGFDLGAIHAATPAAADKISDDLASRDPSWLARAAKIAAMAVEQDFEEWRRN
ncbi:DUF2252 family protein [Methylocystis sp.]